MKKAFASLLSTMFATAILAQSATGHLQFLDTPINGTVSSFVEKMENKGLKFNSNIDRNAIMTGTYEGYENITVFIQSCSKKDLVFGVGVTFGHQTKWDSLECNYRKLKAMLTQRYGKPSECTERMNGDSVNTFTAEEKMAFTRQGKCDYFTVYQTPEGTVNLGISNAQYGEETVCYVQLDFLDKQNVANEKTVTRKTVKE